MSEQALVEDQEHKGIAPLAQLIASGKVSPEAIEKMMELQERWESNEARKAYNNSMTVFRGTVGMAHKSASNGHLRTTYATFNDLVRAVSGPLGSAGFNYTFKQKQEGNSVTVICTITHADGHSESTELTAGIEGNKGINSLQALGLTVSYLKRYTLAALTGVGTEDSDGEPLAPLITMLDEDDMKDIEAVCTEVGKDYGRWLEWMGTRTTVLNGVLQMDKHLKVNAIAQLRKEKEPVE